MKSTWSSERRIRTRPDTFRVAALLLAGLVGEAAAATENAAPEAGPKPGMAVMVAQAVRGCFSEVVNATGFLVPRATAVAMLPLEGYEVAEILARDGEVVSEKQSLARLVRPGREGQQANHPGGGGGPPSTIMLRAPAAGRIVSSTAAVGAAASVRGLPLFRIAIDGLIEADVEVSSIYLVEIKENQTVRIVPERGREISGRVRRIGSEIDPVTQMGHVRVALDNDSSLRAGRFVRATIDTGESCGISIPKSAVLYSTDGTSVQVVRGNLVETVRVRVGTTSEDNVEIETGLRDGDVVVAHAGTSLRDGDRVAPVFIDDNVRATGPR